MYTYKVYILRDIIYTICTYIQNTYKINSKQVFIRQSEVFFETYIKDTYISHAIFYILICVVYLNIYLYTYTSHLYILVYYALYTLYINLKRKTLYRSKNISLFRYLNFIL